MAKTGTALVLILRRSPRDLSDEEISLIQRAFAGRDVQFRRIDPANYQEHDTLCAQLQPEAVILPMDRPIPSLAMEHGFVHVTVKDGKVMKLEPMETNFTPFVPD